jgi:hypothetical protein
MGTSLAAGGRGVRHGLYAKSEKSVRARNQGMRRIMNHVLAIAPWLSDSDRQALRAWCESEWLTRRVMLVLTQTGLQARAAIEMNIARPAGGPEREYEGAADGAAPCSQPAHPFGGNSRSSSRTVWRTIFSRSAPRIYSRKAWLISV